MSLLKSNSVQIGQSATATQNFTLSVPSSPDGTIKLARGNSGATTADVLTVDASGNVTTTLAGGSVKFSQLSTSATEADNVAKRTAKAWVNFDGTNAFSPNPSTTAIRASFNVSSITDNGTGNFTVNFTASMSDVNYAVFVSSRPPVSTNGGLIVVHDTTAPTAASVTFNCSNSVFSAGQDNAAVYVSIFR